MDNGNNSNVILFKPRKAPELPLAQQKISSLHITVLNSLTAYTAYSLRIGHETVQAMVLTTFRVHSYEQLHEDDFSSAVEYLITLHDDHPAIH